MPYIKTYPGIHDTDLVNRNKNELIETLAVQADIETNGPIKDRSETGVYAMSLNDGRIITMYGPSLESLFQWNGDVEYRVVISHKDGTQVENECIQKVSGEYGLIHSNKNPMDLPAEVLEEMAKIAKAFVAANIHRVKFRKKIKNSLTELLESENAAK